MDTDSQDKNWLAPMRHGESSFMFHLNLAEKQRQSSYSKIALHRLSGSHNANLSRRAYI